MDGYSTLGNMFAGSRIYRINSYKVLFVVRPFWYVVNILPSAKAPPVVLSGLRNEYMYYRSD